LAKSVTPYLLSHPEIRPVTQYLPCHPERSFVLRLVEDETESRDLLFPQKKSRFLVSEQQSECRNIVQ